MTQEEKSLLLKDLCARLPYGVRGKIKADGVDTSKHDIDGFPLEITFDVDVELLRIDTGNDEIFVSTFDDNEDKGNYIEECQIDGTPWTIEEFTPYLRPMSSMTEEEKEGYHELCDNYYGIYFDTVASIDWLNKKMFDYRKDDEGKTMIKKGLALEAPEGMYKLKEK